MLSRTLAIVLGAFVLGGSALTGCSSDAGDGTQEEGELQAQADGVKTNVLGYVTAIKVNGDAIIASPKKVKKVLSATGLASTNAKPKKGALRCMGQYNLEFLDFAGETVASANYLCETNREAAQGTLRVGDTSYVVEANLDTIDAIAELPLVVSDVLYGIDQVEVSYPNGASPDVTISDRADIKEMLTAIDGEQVPDVDAPETRCLPSKVVTFLRGETKAGFAALTCSPGAEGIVTAQFRNDDVRFGAIKVDASTIKDVEKSVAPPESQ